MLLKMKEFYIYIIQSETTGKYYIGHTHNIDERLYQHNNHTYKGSLSTKRLKGPWKLVYSKEFETRSDAMQREKIIKSWKSHKAIDKFILAQLEESRQSRD